MSVSFLQTTTTCNTTLTMPFPKADCHTCNDLRLQYIFIYIFPFEEKLQLSKFSLKSSFSDFEMLLSKFYYHNLNSLFSYSRDQIHQTVFNDIHQIGWHFIWEIQWKWRNMQWGNIKSLVRSLWQKVAGLSEHRSGTYTLHQFIVLIAHWMNLTVYITRDITGMFQVQIYLYLCGM